MLDGDLKALESFTKSTKNTFLKALLPSQNIWLL